MNPPHIHVPQYFRQSQMPLADGDQVVAVNYRVSQTNELVRVNSDSNLLIFVLHGQKHVGLATEQIEVGEGSFLFIPRGNYIMNQIVEASQRTYQSLILSLSDALISEFSISYLQDRQHNNTNKQSFKSIAHPQLRLEVDALVSYFFERGETVNPHLVRLKATELLLHIIECDPSQVFANLLISISRQKHDRFEQYLHENALLAVSLEEHANQLCMSLSTFKRQFRKHFGKSPAEWFVDQKLNAARQLLLESNHSIGDVCFFSGFNNASHFTRLFRHKFGSSPAQYRQQQMTRSEQIMNEIANSPSQ